MNTFLNSIVAVSTFVFVGLATTQAKTEEVFETYDNWTIVTDISPLDNVAHCSMKTYGVGFPGHFELQANSIYGFRVGITDMEENFSLHTDEVFIAFDETGYGIFPIKHGIDNNEYYVDIGWDKKFFDTFVNSKLLDIGWDELTYQIDLLDVDVVGFELIRCVDESGF